MDDDCGLARKTSCLLLNICLVAIFIGIITWRIRKLQYFLQIHKVKVQLHSSTLEANVILKKKILKSLFL